MNKRGWIRIIEAFSAVLLITGVALIILSQGYVEKREIYSEIHEVETGILKEVQLNNQLRTDILNIPNINMPINYEDGGFPDSVKNKINEKIPYYLTCTSQICSMNSVCVLDELFYQNKDIYVQSVVISANLEKYSPRQLKLFCLVKGKELLCAPNTCLDLGKECGTQDDGCGGFIDCGNCSEGETCVSGSCVIECAPDCEGKECGTDGCGGTCPPNNCSEGETCVSGSCVIVCSLIQNSTECELNGCEWVSEEIFSDDFTDHDNWDDNEHDWNNDKCSPTNCAHGNSFNPSYFELNQEFDLSSITSAKIVFDYKETGILESTDCLYYNLYDGEWSDDILLFCDDIGENYLHNEINIPVDYYINNFNFRFKGTNFNSREHAYIDNFEITAGSCV